MISKDMKKSILEYLRDIIYLLVVMLLVFLVFFRVVVVSGGSMNQTLYNGDVLLLLNGDLCRDYNQGDIVVASKASFNDGEPIIKRVIATEGQMVDIDFFSGVVYVDGKPLDEPYTNTPTNVEEGMYFPLTVSEGCIFVMGDNRNYSTDSRNPDIGLIDTREIVGKVLLLVFPGRDSFGRLQLNRIGGVS